MSTETDPAELVAAALEREAELFTRGPFKNDLLVAHLHGTARNYRKGWRDPRTGEYIEPEHSCYNCDAPADPTEGPRCLNCGEEWQK